MDKVFEDEFTLIQTDMIEVCEKYADDKADIVYVYASYEDDTISCDYFYRIGTCLVERHKLNDISDHNYDTSIERQRECMGALVEDMQKLIMLCKEYNKEMPTEIKLIYDTHNNKMDANYSYEEKYCFDEIKTADDIAEEWFEEIKNMNWKTSNKMLAESSKITRKEIEKYINEVQKVERKKYGYRKRADIIFKKYKDYFVSISAYATGVNDDTLVISGKIKPYYFDDVFWEVFKMPENSNEPMGLRANGAFSIRSFELFEDRRTINDYAEVTPYVTEKIAEYDRKLCEAVDNFGEDPKNFIDYMDTIDNTGMYDKALGKMLYYIKTDQYDMARELAAYEISQNRYGSFGNEGKYIYEHVVDYCEGDNDNNKEDYSKRDNNEVGYSERDNNEEHYSEQDSNEVDDCDYAETTEQMPYGYLDRQIKKWKVISIVCWIATLMAGQRILYNVYDGIDTILYPFDPSYRVHSIINLIVVMVVLILIFALCLYGAITSKKKYKRLNKIS